MSDDGLYLTKNGQPWFINGDTGWSLIGQLSLAEAETYLDNRAAKGYNAVIVNLIEAAFADRAPANQAGNPPFMTPGNLSTASGATAYWSHADAVIRAARDRGIVVFLYPMYVGYQCGSEGWCSVLQANSLANCTAYGEFLGNRYRDYDNIVWVIGGDANPSAHSGVAARLEAIVNGIKTYDTRHIWTAHNAPENSAMDQWAGKAWLGVNNVYTYDSPPIAKVIDEYDRSGALPFYLLETAYENEHSSTPLTLRRQNWQAVLWGARLGHFFGNCPMWHFGGGSGPSFCGGNENWASQLNSTGSTQLTYLGKLMKSRRHWLMRPDRTSTVMTAGVQTGTSQATTSRATDGSSVIAYIPTRRQVTIDMTEVGGSTARAWWYDPRTGAAALISTYATSGTQNFTPPDSNDWVLVIDNDSIGFATPGQ
jgi:hypothetical protein